MIKSLYLLCGIPGSGKSTWAREFIKSHDRCSYISRDAVRFSLQEDINSDNYFDKEKQVFKSFVESINESISSDEVENIIVDATHINFPSRNKLISNINNTDNVQIICVVFNCDLQKCLNRNDLREGVEKIPRSVIRRMHSQFKHPRTDDYFYYDIIEVYN